MDELQKIDQIRERFPVSYEEAREVLSEADGDVVKALILLENERSLSGIMGDQIQEVKARLQSWVRRSNSASIVVSQGKDLVVKMPVTAGLVGAITAPRLAVVGAVAALIGGCKFNIQEKADDAVQIEVMDEPTHPVLH